jgi:hypothetical protein
VSGLENQYARALKTICVLYILRSNVYAGVDCFSGAAQSFFDATPLAGK